MCSLVNAVTHVTGIDASSPKTDLQSVQGTGHDARKKALLHDRTLPVATAAGCQHNTAIIHRQKLEDLHPYLKLDASFHLHGLVLRDPKLPFLGLAHVQVLLPQCFVQLQDPDVCDGVKPKGEPRDDELIGVSPIPLRHPLAPAP